MKRSEFSRLFSVMASVMAALFACGTAQGQTDFFWNVANGDFSTGTNWNPTGPPLFIDNAFINNGGTATVSSGTSEAFVLELGSAGGASGTFNVTGGEYIGNDRIRIGEVGTGTATFSGGTVQVPSGQQDIFVGGEESGGIGTLTISGASTSVNPSDDFILGRVGTGTLHFQSGWLTGGYTVVGKFGTGTWNQSGGVYEQSFGDVEIGDGGVPGDSGTVGPRLGTINLTNGVLQSAGYLAIGNRVGGGEVNVSGGALAITGSVTDGSIVIGRGMNWESEPLFGGGATTLRVIGDDSTIIANGSLSMNPLNVHQSSTLIAKITGSTHTTIKVAGNADIGNGSFKVELEGYTPVLGNTWTIIEAGADIADEKTAVTSLASSLTTAPLFDGIQHADPAFLGTRIGEFESEDFSLAPLSAGLQWDVEYTTNAVLLKIIAAAGVDGDYNGDGTVNAADYTVWRDGGSPDDTIAGYNLWKANFGSSGSGSSAAVPEPSSVALAVLLAAMFCRLKGSTPHVRF